MASSSICSKDLGGTSMEAAWSASTGFVPTVRHADCIGPWLEVLREENRAIVRAARAASKAADRLLAFVETGETADDDIEAAQANGPGQPTGQGTFKR